jgi:hypothetical protein
MICGEQQIYSKMIMLVRELLEVNRRVAGQATGAGASVKKFADQALLDIQFAAKARVTQSQLWVTRHRAKRCREWGRKGGEAVWTVRANQRRPVEVACCFVGGQVLRKDRVLETHLLAQ